MTEIVVFDLDDTLFPERQFVRSGFKAADEWLSKDRAMSGFFEAAWRIFEGGGRNTVFDQALRELGAADDRGLVSKLVEVYRAHKPTIELFADARWALEHCRSGAKLGLLTDGYLLTQKNKVEALGIAAAFDALVYTDELGRENWKPSPVPFLKLMGAFPAKNARYTYVGDNPAKDFAAPKALGWATIQILREGCEYGSRRFPSCQAADRVISSLKELRA